MTDLEFLPAWYTRMLRRRRVIAVLGAVAGLATVVAVFAMKW
jgi:hypothetical protein